MSPSESRAPLSEEKSERYSAVGGAGGRMENVIIEEASMSLE